MLQTLSKRKREETLSKNEKATNTKRLKGIEYENVPTLVNAINHDVKNHWFRNKTQAENRISSIQKILQKQKHHLVFGHGNCGIHSKITEYDEVPDDTILIILTPLGYLANGSMANLTSNGSTFFRNKQEYSKFVLFQSKKSKYIRTHVASKDEKKVLILGPGDTYVDVNLNFTNTNHRKLGLWKLPLKQNESPAHVISKKGLFNDKSGKLSDLLRITGPGVYFVISCRGVYKSENNIDKSCSVTKMCGDGRLRNHDERNNMMSTITNLAEASSIEKQTPKNVSNTATAAQSLNLLFKRMTLNPKRSFHIGKKSSTTPKPKSKPK